MNLKIGYGTDIHRLIEGRELWVGGIQIEFHKGGEGHSIPDPLLHAIIDAFLGAAGLRDIGYHFPDTDPQYKNISSNELLKRTFDLIKDSYKIVNIDTVVHLEAPKLNIHIPKMCKTIAQILQLSEEQINIKAKTAEGLGSIGQGMAYKAEAIVLLQKTDQGN